ncbi:MAG: hypothetical protein Q8S84_07310 [bacterium]|nr:hypothetical protein [bacterium]MDP3381260.1 hypothetical protein [bacterium]
MKLSFVNLLISNSFIAVCLSFAKLIQSNVSILLFFIVTFILVFEDHVLGVLVSEDHVLGVSLFDLFFRFSIYFITSASLPTQTLLPLLKSKSILVSSNNNNAFAASFLVNEFLSFNQFIYSLNLLLAQELLLFAILSNNSL